jgi:hypothetical protein
MAAKDRINGTVPFTCENRAFKTNIHKGVPHSASQARGSVFDAPLIDHGDNSLWLEHVTVKADGSDCFWLMWYDADGTPTIPLSGVLEAGDIKRLAGRLAAFIQVP